MLALSPRLARCAPLPALFVLLLPLAAAAGSETHYQDTILGERAAGMGGAFTALADEATGAYYNPAGIVVDRSTIIQLSMSAFKLYRRSSRLADVCGRTIDDEQAGVFGFPAALGFVKLLGSGSVRHALGLTLLVPHATKQSASFVARDIDCDPVIVDVGGSSVWLDRVFLGGLSYAIRPWRFLQLGMTLGASVRGLALTDLTAMVSTAAGPAATHPYVSFAHVDVNIWSLYLQFGAIVEPLAGLRFGVSVTTPHFRVAGAGRLDVIEAYYAEDLAVATGVAWAVDDAEYHHRVPFALALGLAYRQPGRFTLAADVKLHGAVSPYAVVTHPDLVQDLARLQRDLVVNVNLGGELNLGQRWAVRAGLFTNLTSHPALEPTDSGLDDHVHLFGATLGATFYSSAQSAFSVAVQGQAGSGEAVSVALEGDPAGGMPRPRPLLADVQDLSLVLSVGGSFDLR